MSKIDEVGTVIVKTHKEERTFHTLRSALLYCWDEGCENVIRIEKDGELFMLQEAMWKS